MALLFCVAVSASDEVPPPNYDETKIPPYVLPDALLLNDGRKVDSAALWYEVRRAELLDLFEDNVYGKPTLHPKDNPFKTDVELFDSSPVFDGKGRRYQFRITFFQGEKPVDDDPTVDLLIYRPADAPEGRKKESGRFPMFLGYNFKGNHTVHADPGIRLGNVWNQQTTRTPGREEDRGISASRWPIETLLDHGFAVGTAYYGSIEPDTKTGLHFGVRRFLYPNGERPEPNEAAAIATWAWGLGRLLDVVTTYEKELEIDSKKVVVLGHSRLGKTALWAGAIDPRFAIVISNNSGCGGAALSRREFGETVHRINTAFAWFCDNFKKYNRAVDALPVDQHELIALIAPRPVYIAGASQDLWADPKGEFLGAWHAAPVYRLLGTDGFGDVEESSWSIPDRSMGATIGYHLRTGSHDITEFDWLQYLRFAEKHFRP